MLRDEQRQAGEAKSGKAALTGSAAHLAVEMLHRGYAMDDIVRACATKFPGADLRRAGFWVGQYQRDPRNQDCVLVDSQEAEVTLTLEADEPIKLVGHVDQIRKGEDGQLYVWDIKTGRGDTPVFAYAWQIAAYALACTETFGETVLPGGIIRLRSYVDELGLDCPYCGAEAGDDCVTKSGKPAQPHSKRDPLLLDPETAPVFRGTSWSLAQCRTMLRSFVKLVEHYRRGEVLLTPGDHCRYCPAGGPQVCAEQLAC